VNALTPEQAQAVGRRDIDVFCEAGAGTGKTSVLVGRFVAAVCEDEVGMGDLLAFTFTERAADQLRGRVRGALRVRAREAGAAGDDGRRLELERLARDTEAAWISTIHGFCRRLLAAHPVAAGIDPRFRVLDEGESSRLRSRAFWAALDALLSGGDPDATSRIVAALTPNGLRSIVISAHDELRSRGEEAQLPQAPVVDPAAAVAELGEAAAEALEECESATGRSAPDMLERLGRARDLADRAPAGEPPELDDVIPLELKSGAKPFAGRCCERYRAAWTAARKALAQAEMADSYELIRELLAAYDAKYERLKSIRSGLDFEDLQLRARDLLRDNEVVRARYRDRFRHLLVDEFQDTNQVQLELIRLVQGPETRLFCVGDELQSIYGFRHADLAVFRRERKRFREMGDAGQVMPLTGNFRALPEVLGAVNAIGEALIERFEPLTVGAELDPDAATTSPAVELMMVASDNKENDWSADEVGLGLDEDEPAPAHRIAEARLLASRLAKLQREGVPRREMVVLLRSYTWVDTYERALIDAGLEPYVIGGRGYWSQQQVEDMLVLLGVIANPLDDEALLGALASPACAVTPDTLWLLRRVALDRRERGFSTRLWPALRDIAAGEVPAEGEGRSWAEAIGDDETGRLRGFVDRIQGLREDAPLLGLEGTIQAACERLGYDLATLMRPGGEARWANVRKLMRLAREYESNDGADLRGFLEYAGEETARAGEGEAPTAAEEHDGVRIMTVHGAKGLEFEAVAVPELGRRILAGFPPAIRIGTTEPSEEPQDEAPSPLRVGLRLARLGRPSERLYDLDELEERAKVEEAAEELRLAHVAFTRAKRRLILSGTYNPGKDPARSLLPGSPVTERLIYGLHEGPLGTLLALEETCEGEIEVPPPEPRPGLNASFNPARIAVSITVPAEGAGAALAPSGVAEAAPAPPTESITPPLLDVAVEPVSSARLSYSALSAYAACGYRFLIERELGLAPRQPGAGLPAAASLDEGEADPGDVPAREARFGFGNAIHGLLEWSARNRWRRPDVDRIRRHLQNSGLPGKDGELERSETALAGWLESPLCRELGTTEVGLRPEEPFLLPIEGAVIRGSIDLLARDPDRPPLVVDYKTDRLDRDPGDLIDRYSVQRDIYALAASGGGPVRTAYVFLERPLEPVEMEYGAADLGRARDHVIELLGGIAAGRFEVTRRPHRALCADCPARERLCSHETAAQMRQDPDPPIEPAGRGEPAETGEPQLSLLDGS
jgi:ATP-dependent exoDNAse (exonuclease V) beta subunit